MIRRIIKIATIIIICILLILGINFGVKKLTEVRYQEKSLQQEAIKDKNCKNVFSFQCPKKGGECKMKYNKELYLCTKEGKTVDKISKISSIVIIVVGMIAIGFTIYRNKII